MTKTTTETEKQMTPLRDLLYFNLVSLKTTSTQTGENSFSSFCSLLLSRLKGSLTFTTVIKRRLETRLYLPGGWWYKAFWFFALSLSHG